MARTELTRRQTACSGRRYSSDLKDAEWALLAPLLREQFCDSVEALQADLDDWLVHCNTERPHLGYRNMGRMPTETAMSFVRQEG